MFFLFAAALALASAAVLAGAMYRAAPANDAHAAAIAVYKRQLAEVERDLDAGRLSAGEAEAARTEISRRILAEGEAGGSGAASASWWKQAATVLLTGVPVAGLALYLALGAAGLPDQPLADRVAREFQHQDIAVLLAQVEKHLADNPSDLRGWSVVAPVYLRLGRFDQAAAAYRSIIRLGGSTPDAQAGLGEALVGAGDGLVTEEARKAFEAALEQDPGSIRARFFLAIAAEQDGAREDAAKRWRALLEDPADPDGGWREVARNRLAALGAPGPDADAVRAAEDMSAADRDAMIRGMVEGLAARLENNPDDLDGWMRLVRAYTVLGEAEAARAALGKARNAFAGDAGAGERLDGLARELGIDS